MYIGSTGDGSLPEDGIYVLVKEVIDNSIDEFASGFGREIRITIEDREVTLAIFHDCIGEDIYTPATGGSMVSTVDDVVYIVDIK